MLHREPEAEVLAECKRENVAFLPYFPLASGLLTGKYRRGAPVPTGTRLSGGGQAAKLLTPQNLDVVEALIKFAESHHHTLLELAFSWLLAREPVASVIAGATSVDQVRSNAAAADWRVTGAELAEVDGMLAV